MTEEEAFIRTIVDRPGDDLPRLVYADWLDERDDPRGAYLRAEAEWAKAKQTAGFIVLRLNGLAEGLDPVWVARVSRPPVGVCCDHVRIEGVWPAENTIEGVGAIARRLGVELPPVVEAVLTNTAGRRLNPNEFRLWIEDNDTAYIFQFDRPFHTLAELALQPSMLARLDLRETDHARNSTFLEIANDGYGGLLMLEIGAGQVRAVRYFAADLAPHCDRVATSIPEFLTKLHHSGRR